MANKEPGYVYILTNPSFREDWVKIGKSSRPVDIRSKELDNTAVPLPFEIYATLQTVKYDVVEKKIHKAIDRLTDLRIRQNREFFNIKPELALEIFKDEAMILDDAIITMYENNQPIVSANNGYGFYLVSLSSAPTLKDIIPSDRLLYPRLAGNHQLNKPLESHHLKWMKF